MEQAVVKILLLGICGYGSNYIKEISERDIPGIKIEGICEVVPNAADLYPIIKEQNIPIYQTPEDFYKEHTADLAVVSTPIHLHYSQIVTCLTHGSNVLTEKPVCTSVEGAHKLEQLEKETGKFISVGYQLNYSRDVLALKHDILDDHFGKPIYMKALHAMRRGDKYYARNSWAGHIDVKGCAVNDSPFNNACAHQFQVMTFLLGERLERAAELADVHFAGTTLTWYTTLNGNVSDNFANLGDTPWAKYVEEQTGITIEFQHPTQGSEAEEFAVMLASGEYPDIIEYTWTTYSGGAGAAINDGVIISLDDYMADATNLSKVIQEHPEIGKMIKSSGGNYYCFPCLRGLESPNKTEFSSGFLYRADALKELGFDQVPETIDEWEEVLRAAKAAGYSKPFTTRKEWVKDVWSAAYDNWGSFYVDDGVVKNGLIEDSRKDFIQKMADWYAEGLLDNDWMQADKKSTQTDFVSGNCILGYAPFGQGLGNYTKAMMEADPNFKEDYIQAAAPVTSTKGKNAKFSKMNNIYDQSGASAAISSQCKNVKAAVWLLDWLYSEEGQICYNFGIEGESYEMKDGKPVYTDLIMNNPDGMSVAQALAAYTRASTSGAGIQSEDYIDQYYAQDNQKKALELSMKTDMGEHMFPPTSVSEENQDRYSEIMSQVKTLADEMEASFICGTTPMSEWDSYQQKLKDAGIEEAVQMMQEAYDTYMAN